MKEAKEDSTPTGFLKKCAWCNEEIPVASEYCPHCREKQSSFGSPHPTAPKISQRVDGNAIQFRKLLLDFYSSELTTHGSLIIGFAAILFTILQIIQKLKDDPLKIVSTEQIGICITGLLLTATALWFLLMRHLAYGILSSAVIETELDEQMNLRGALVSVRNRALKNKIFSVIPSSFFISSGDVVTESQRMLGLKGVSIAGILVCFIPGAVTTYLFLGLLALA